MSYQIEFRNHLKAFGFTLTVLILLIGFCLYIEATTDEILFGLAFYSIFFLPSLYLHIEYYLKNRGQQLEIFEDEIVFYSRDGQVKKYAMQDLQRIVLYKSASLDKGGIPLTPIESYHYARIITKLGEEIILTCLMAPDVEAAIKQIRSIQYIRKKQLFASLN